MAKSTLANYNLLLVDCSVDEHGVISSLLLIVSGLKILLLHSLSDSIMVTHFS